MAELSVTASIPPGVTFTIGRIDEAVETRDGAWLPYARYQAA